MKRSKPPQDHTSSASLPTEVRAVVIGYVRSPYKERFGTPRQPVVRDQVLGDDLQPATIELLEQSDYETALRGLAEFEYIWAITWLHLNRNWAPLVMPPRGPRVKQGVFATRSPNRPNPIGLSALKLIRIEGRRIEVLGVDLLDGTPVLDLKPYVPYADAFPNARAGWLDALGEPMTGPDLFEPS